MFEREPARDFDASVEGEQRGAGRHREEEYRDCSSSGRDEEQSAGDAGSVRGVEERDGSG